MIVVDASAIVDLLLRRPDVAALEARLVDPGEDLAAPELLDVEVAQVLRRYALRGELDDTRGHEAIEDLGSLRIRRFPHRPFLDAIWALRKNLSAYDAAYIALADALGVPLITRDRRLARAGTSVTVEVL